MTTIIPVPGTQARECYKTAAPPYPIDLHLSGNEGAAPPRDLLLELSDADIEGLRSYPCAAELESALAKKCGVDSGQVLVTAGGDEALDRACRTMLAQGRKMLLPWPSFVMLEKYALMARAKVVKIAWPSGPYPTRQVIDAIDGDTALIAVVSPNNPTGAVATPLDLELLSAAAPAAMLMVDLAYGEFADVDLTPTALRLPNAVVFKTLSKAWGIAGLRVGYCVGAKEVVSWLRAAASPYSVSGLSMTLALRHISSNSSIVARSVDAVRRRRPLLEAQLAELGARPLPSQANFVMCRPRQGSLHLSDGLARRGIAVRSWPGDALLEGAVRITCPTETSDFDRLRVALDEVLGADRRKT